MPAALQSGRWTGTYTQFGHHYPQALTLEFADGIMRGDGVDGVGNFVVDGEYRVDADGTRVGWVKTYEGSHSVLYVGTLEGGRIVGAWSLSDLPDEAFELRYQAHPQRSPIDNP